MNKEFKAVLEKRISKNDKEYYVLVVAITPTYQKIVFLDQADTEIIKLISSK